jgi:hypothetical protein
VTYRGALDGQGITVMPQSAVVIEVFRAYYKGSSILSSVSWAIQASVQAIMAQLVSDLDDPVAIVGSA